MAGRDASQRFLEATRSASSCLQEGSSGRQSVSLQKQVIDRLQDMHMCIVELDYNLDEHQSPAGTADDNHAAEACRQWLKQAQGYVLHVMKNIEALGSKSGGLQEQGMAQAEEQEQEEGNGSSADAAWLVLCQDAYEVLSRVADHLAGGASSDDESPKARRHSRIVYPVSRLPYNTYWSKKIAL